MNDLLQLKGTFQERPHSNTPGPRNIPVRTSGITSNRLKELLSELENLRAFWKQQSIIVGCLIDVCYIDVVAKSNRITGYLSTFSSPANKSVVGARFDEFTDEEKGRKHIITHYISDAIVGSTIKNISACINLIDEEFNSQITYDNLEYLKKVDIDYDRYGITKTAFRNIIVDTHYVEGFKMPNNSANVAQQSIIAIYKTSKETKVLMSEIGIHVDQSKLLSPTTLLLYPDEIKLLLQKAPYLVAMATEDITKLNFGDIVRDSELKPIMTIPSPKDEPIIGVIDTLFDESVYFSEWVEFEKMISDEIPIEPKAFDHGTSVSSIIVDGPAINPDLDDGCGRFRVKHFGVAAQGQYSAFVIMKKIEEIVIANPTIRVWNLSLGADREANKNFISPEASTLDRIQYENDVIFIVAGTNKRTSDANEKRVGPPADSINSIVVNSTNKNGKPASYSRKGPILSFFTKPDVSVFGGDKEDYVHVCAPAGESLCGGTSYAAPWVTRKVAYLIEVLGFSREVAKALIIDAAAGWHNTAKDFQVASLRGFGVLPKEIDSIVKSADDEIKFVINGTAEKWDTYNYNLPVPRHNEAHPFVAKATLCYFPKCSINQGVDYTDTELDVYFGRIGKDGKIKTINDNVQSLENGIRHYVYEGTAREFYRKWDNVKHIKKVFSDRVRAMKSYGDGLWGLSIKTKDRTTKRDSGINFGLVVTLKEINGINRINDFIRQCELRGWLVNRVNVSSRINIYSKAQETIKFE
jgi:hypothetical protein